MQNGEGGWSSYRPSKTLWAWSIVGASALTMAAWLHLGRMDDVGKGEGDDRHRRPQREGGSGREHLRP